MKVIISNTIKDNFTEFKVVDNFSWVEEHIDEIELIIFHSISDSDFSTGVYISRFSKKGTIKFVYINENPQTTIKMVIAGTGGHIITDEFYLEDEEELLELIKSLNGDEEETSVSVVSINVVKDFVQSFARNEAKINTPAYLQMVNDAINSLSVVTKQQELQITTMGNSAIDIFQKAHKLIQNMEAKRVEIENQLKILENSQDSVASTSNSSSFNSNVVSYPTYKYLKTTPVLLIREYSPCRYLTSFALGYTHHVHYAKNKKVKLVVIHQKGGGVSAKYDNFTSINDTSLGYTSFYNNELLAINTPQKEVLRALFDQPDDVFIIVDRLYGNNDIISGKISKLNAVGGLSDINRFHLEPKDTLVSIRKDDNVFATLMTMKNYVNEVDARYAAYEQMYEDVYDKLDNLLGLNQM